MATQAHKGDEARVHDPYRSQKYRPLPVSQPAMRNALAVPSPGAIGMWPAPDPAWLRCDMLFPPTVESSGSKLASADAPSQKGT